MYDFYVQQCGIFIHFKFKFLVGFSDGLIDQDFLLENKCPYAVQEIKIEEAVKTKLLNFVLYKILNYT